MGELTFDQDLPVFLDLIYHRFGGWLDYCELTYHVALCQFHNHMSRGRGNSGILSSFLTNREGCDFGAFPKATTSAHKDRTNGFGGRGSRGDPL
jgi:hypothetical protein